MPQRHDSSRPGAFIALIGLGAMGSPWLSHLPQLGCKATAYARSRAVAAELGVPVCPTPAKAAQGVEFIFTNATSTEDMRTVLCGADGAMHGARLGAVCIDHSAISPEGARKIAQTLRAAGRYFLDALLQSGWGRDDTSSLLRAMESQPRGLNRPE